jgi:hypothetical protein
VESPAIEAAPRNDAPPDKQRPAGARKVFISYASQDRKFALRLADDLRDNGLIVWIDQSEIRGGHLWPQKLDEGLAASNEVFLIVSPHTTTSPYVQKELSTAINNKKTITPLLLCKRPDWVLIADCQDIDFRWWYEEAFAKLLEREPPPRTFWREILIILKKLWAFRPLLAAIAVSVAIAAYLYFLSPSSTSFTVAGGEQSALLVRIRNEGGRPSLLLASSFKLDFGNLPIEPEPLVLLQPETNTRVAGHADMTLRLTADRMLTPKKKDEESYFNQHDLEPLLKGARVRLTAQVKESDDRLYTRSQDLSADGIKRFILEEFPDDVP